VLLTTHYLEEAEALADRIVVVAHGRIVADGTTADIRAAAAGATIRCRTSLPEQALMQLAGVRRASRSGGEVRLLSRNAVETVRALLERTDDCADLRIEAASLEDALSTLTAPALREAA
jgi:ABC-2 type transport system ATP-binding protein